MQAIAQGDAKGDHRPDDTIMDSPFHVVHNLSSIELPEHESTESDELLVDATRSHCRDKAPPLLQYVAQSTLRLSTMSP